MMARLQRLPQTYFNSRPSARGDICPKRGAKLYSNFNSRPSARGDARGGKIENAGKYFNSRPSARGDGYDVQL